MFQNNASLSYGGEIVNNEILTPSGQIIYYQQVSGASFRCCCVDFLQSTCSTRPCVSFLHQQKTSTGDLSQSWSSGVKVNPPPTALLGGLMMRTSSTWTIV